MPHPDREANAFWGADDADVTWSTSSSYIRLERSSCSGSDGNIMPSSSSYLAYGRSVATNPIDPTAHIGAE